MPDSVGTTIAGQQFRAYQRGAASAGADQYVVPVDDKVVSWAGRASTFRIPGVGSASTQVLATLFNASGSTTLVNVNRIMWDMTTTVAKAATVVPPVVRPYRVTAAPTGGTALVKAPFDTTNTSNASVTALQGASADRTASAITATLTTARFSGVPAPRMLTAVGYEPVDPFIFFEGSSDVVLRASEGIAIVVENADATGNPATDFWVVTIDWIEYTRP